jgi:Spy/CpxP family protein refolding chaperone
MKNLIKPLALSVLLASSTFLAKTGQNFAQAQTATTPTSESIFGAQTGKIIDSVTAALNDLDLSDDQKNQLTAISVKYAPQVRDTASDTALDGPQKHQRMRALRFSAMAEMVAVLNPSQKAKLNATQGELKKHVRVLMSQISVELGLTPIQKKQIQALLVDAHSQASAIFSDTSLSRLEKRRKLVALRHNFSAMSTKILDRSQLATWNSIVAQIRSALESRAVAWRTGGTLGIGLID